VSSDDVAHFNCTCFINKCSAKSETTATPATAATTSTTAQPQPKPAQPPTPIPEDANTSFQPAKGDSTATSSINPNTFAITGSRSGSVSEPPKESGGMHTFTNVP